MSVDNNEKRPSQGWMAFLVQVIVTCAALVTIAAGLATLFGWV